MAIAVACRGRRDDPHTGWLIAVGGCFAGCAVAFSFAQGIFHPYYVVQLAPFTAALVGAGVARFAEGSRLAPVALAAGVLVEILVVDRDATQAKWAIPLVMAVAAGTAVVLADASSTRKIRMGAIGVGLAALLAAPASWAFATVGHATGTTFPAGGPAEVGGLGAGGGPPAFAATGGGPFGGDANTVTRALAYVAANGGGTVGVSSQTGASEAIIDSGAKVAGIGGFSGRESQVSADRLADAVEDGRIRWVLTSETSGFMAPADGRVGSTNAMTIAAEACTEATDALYDCSGQADAIRSAS